MADNPKIFQNLQLGAEATAGTAVAANKQLLDMKIMTDIDGAVDTFKPSGRRFSTIIQPNKEWGTGKVEGKAGYNTLTWIFQSLMKKVTPTRNIVGTGLSYLWVWSPTPNDLDAFQTYTVESGNAVRAEKFPFGIFNGVELTGNREEVSLSGDMFMQRMIDGITLTATPTSIEPVLLFPQQGDVYFATTQAGLAGASPLNRVFEWKMNYGDVYGQVWPVKSAASSWDGVVAQEVKATLDLDAQWDTESFSWLTDMRAGARRFVRIEYIGATIETTYKYKLTMDMCVGFNQPPKKGDADEVLTRQWSFDIMEDATWGKAIEVTLQNTIAAL